ncbi:unnamed protein product, partial [Caenorhabditis auriculariae]
KLEKRRCKYISKLVFSKANGQAAVGKYEGEDAAESLFIAKHSH